MKQLLRNAFVPFLSALVLIGLAPAQQAAAQYTPGTGFEIAWSLSQDDMALFTNQFGLRGVKTGMDLDGDGSREILFTSDATLFCGSDPDTLEVFLYENTGDNAYSMVWMWSHPEGTNSLPPVDYFDLDNDGAWEIYLGVPTIAGNPLEAQKLYIFEQDATTKEFPTMPTATWDYTRVAADDFRPAGFAFDDVDGDGTTEFVTVSRTSSAGGLPGREMVIANVTGDIGSGFEVWTIEYEVGNDVLGGGSVYNVDIVDYDGDGAKEVWINTWDNFSFTIVEAAAADTYTVEADINDAFVDGDPGSFNYHGFLFANVDGDAGLEMWAPMTNGKLYFLDDVADVSTITGASWSEVGKYSTGEARGASVGDLDGDGLFDIVTSNGSTEIVTRIEYDGVGNPADSTSYEWTEILDSSADLDGDRYYPNEITDDLDGDGNNEVVLTNLWACNPGQLNMIVLEYTGGGVAVEPVGGEIPTDFALDQNYPNPFNPSTSIEFAVPTAQHVYVRVYNILGQEVATLVNGEMLEAGRHRVVWNGRNSAGVPVSSGTYLYSLETNDHRESKRMVLMK